jgi:type 1 glutamine amidotransferase
LHAPPVFHKPARGEYLRLLTFHSKAKGNAMPRLRFAVAAVLAICFAPTLLAQEQKPKPQRPNAQDIERITAALPDKAPATPKQPRKLLVYTKATGFVHSSIPFGAKTFELMGQKTGAFTTVVSDDPESFDPANLKQFDAILMMSTTGSLFVPKDAEKKENLLYENPTNGPIPAELVRAAQLRQSLLDFVRSGKGLMGIHAAADSSYKWKEYGTMLGGQFNGHPWGHIVMRIEDPANPVNTAFENKPFEISDEIYTFKETYSRERQHILTSIDLAASKIDKDFNRPADNDYAVSWLNKYGDGRVFYCSLGHAENTYMNAVVLRHYLAGLQFAFGDLHADAQPSGPLSPERLAENNSVAAAGFQDAGGAGEKAYRDSKEKEQSFTGTLEAIPQPAGVTTTVRAHYYKLGDRLVFTVGKKSKSLDALVGKSVEIRGKAIDTELKGQQLHELWPALVRPAKG